MVENEGTTRDTCVDGDRVQDSRATAFFRACDIESLKQRLMLLRSKPGAENCQEGAEFGAGMGEHGEALRKLVPTRAAKQTEVHRATEGPRGRVNRVHIDGCGLTG